SANRKEGFMASYMLIRHKVRDFSEWKRGYDAHLPKRVEAGLTEKHLLRGAQEPNEVILLFEAKDLNRAKTFAESADLRETMQRVGVVDKPDIYFLNGRDHDFRPFGEIRSGMPAIARRPTCQQDAAEPAVPPDPRTRRYACSTCGPATPDVKPQD